MVNLSDINNEINGWTSHFGIENFQGPARSDQNKNAFAHAYASAVINYDNGILGPAVSNVLGNMREYRTMVTVFVFRVFETDHDLA